VAKLKSFFAHCRPFAIALTYAVTVAGFLWICSLVYIPGKGFTYLIEFGDRGRADYLPELQAVNHYELPDSSGYDAQHYAQIAMHPRLGDPVLRRAVDNLPYRARRILFCLTAYVLAGGQAVRALHIYAVQNIACWLLLAALLLRWFPPNRWDNWVRWVGILFSFGLCVSVRGSLVDGPSLLFIAAGMALAECGWPWLAAAVLGAAGLGRETNVLAAGVFAPAANSRRGWWLAIARGALVVLPLAVWLWILWRWLGDAGGAGARNFSAPFAGYARKWIEVWRIVTTGREGMAWGSVLVQTALTAQALFFFLRPRWSEPWWRVGAAYAVLMIFLGDAVWEGYPGAASRVLLPMALGFNILVPRGRAWFVVLLMGNLSVLVSHDALPLPGRESCVVEGPRALRIVSDSGRVVEAVFDQQWYQPEKSWLEYWRWSRGPATVTFRNPHPFAVVADIRLGLRAADERGVGVWEAGRCLWQGKLARSQLRRVAIRAVRLNPGDTVWQFTTDRPSFVPGNGDARPLTFSLRDLEIDLLGRAP